MQVERQRPKRVSVRSPAVWCVMCVWLGTIRIRVRTQCERRTVCRRVWVSCVFTYIVYSGESFMCAADWAGCIWVRMHVAPMRGGRFTNVRRCCRRNQLITCECNEEILDIFAAKCFFVVVVALLNKSRIAKRLKENPFNILQRDSRMRRLWKVHIYMRTALDFDIMRNWKQRVEIGRNDDGRRVRLAGCFFGGLGRLSAWGAEGLGFAFDRFVREMLQPEGSVLTFHLQSWRRLFCVYVFF